MEKILIEHPWLIAIVLLWTFPWKAVALWKSARRGHLGWFLTLIILNSLAVLDIVYIFFFSDKKTNKEEKAEIEVKKSAPRIPANAQGEVEVQMRSTRRRTAVIQNRSKIL